MPPAETCNGIDDDCDMMVDEGCGGCGSCPGTTTVVAPGGRFSPTLGPHALSGSCGGAGGSETYFTFTLGTPSDVFITTHGSGIDTVLYVRRCACAGTEVGCNDDADGQTTSVLRLPALAADTYNVIVDTKSAMSAPVQVDIYISPPGAAGDRCGNPTLIAAGTTNITGSTCAFTDEYEPVTDTEPLNCPFTGAGFGPEQVFYFVVPTARTVNVDGCTMPTDYDSTIYMRSVCSDPALPAQVMCNDDNCPGVPDCGAGYRSSRSVAVGPGVYYLMIDGYGDVGDVCPCGNYRFDLSGI
jgi:hypothetical protein